MNTISASTRTDEPEDKASQEVEPTESHSVTTSYHMCLDLRGALMNWSDRQWRGVLSDDTGKVLSPRDAKLALMDELSKGRKVIPCSPCDNFDYQKGCQGHKVGRSI